MISVVIPVYNEGNRVIVAYKTLTEYLQKNHPDYELIFVDDGSKEPLERLLLLLTHDGHTRVLTNEQNKGKGYSVRRGVLASRGEYVLYTDADQSTPIEEMEKLMASLEEGYDLVIGSRAMPSSQIRLHQPVHRESSGKAFNILLRTILGLKIKDTQCGFKAFRRDAAQDIFKRQTLDGFCFDAEILLIAKERGYKIIEIPVVWLNSERTSVNLLKQSIRMFLDLLTIKINSLKGKYS
ncbi:MAG: dolichyl-phosphate beta-glucosyltransferase [Candidatus Altiarchaeia archaeon]